MTVFQALVLGLVQGITEFLPISSSAHLILVPHIFGWQDQGLGFDIVVNTGSLVAVLIYFRKDLWATVRQPLSFRSGGSTDDSDQDATVGSSDDGAIERDVEGGDEAATGVPLLPAIVVGTLPVVIAGITVYDWLSTGARNPTLIATTSILFGILLGWSDRSGAKQRTLATLSWRDVVWIGLAEALALIPGTSRSGATLTAALFLGFRREDAARFSFLLYVPVGVAALLHDMKDVVEIGLSGTSILPLAVGFVASAVSAYLVIDWLLDWLQRRPLRLFVTYRIALGLVILGIPLVA